MLITDISRFLLKSAKLAEDNIRDFLEDFANKSKEEIKGYAPVDKGDFQEAWGVTRVSRINNGFSVKVHNDKIYASAIEFGSSPGGKPWPNPGPKTAMKGGRIFSTQAIGGTINKVFNERTINAFTKDLVKEIMRAFK